MEQRHTAGEAIAALEMLQGISRLGFPRGKHKEALEVAKLTLRLNRDPVVIAVDRARMDLFKQYGVEVGEGANRQYAIPPVSQKEFQAAYNQIAEQQIDTRIEPLSLSALSCVEGISPAMLVTLLPFLDEKN